MSGNVVTRTDSEEKRTVAEEEMQKHQAEQKQQGSKNMIISVAGENIQSRETFGSTMIPIDGVISKVTVKLPKVSGVMSLRVLSELDAHTREDTFSVTGGLTTLSEEISVKAGTVVKFSLEFEQESEFPEAYISIIINPS